MTANHVDTSYTVSYDSESHWTVLFQRRGSIWPKVAWYCIFNMVLMIVLTVLDRRLDLSENTTVKIEMASQGHNFIGMVVAFLLVSRVNIALARYNEARTALGVMFRESRELVQSICVLSGSAQTQAAREWRNEAAYRSLLFLRTAMAVINYPTTQQAAWDVPELTGPELEDVKRHLEESAARRTSADNSTVWEETMRVPARIVYLLRLTIHEQSQRLPPNTMQLENRLMGSIDTLMSGYMSMRKFLTTPVPFPLVQMARTFLFFYVFTMPFVLVGDNSSLLAHVFIIFVLSYGFLGLEFVAIELDNPFGDDENDFDNTALAKVAYEDTYLTILDVDGPEWADNLRYRMHDESSQPLLPEQEQTLIPPRGNGNKIKV